MELNKGQVVLLCGLYVGNECQVWLRMKFCCVDPKPWKQDPYCDQKILKIQEAY